MSSMKAPLARSSALSTRLSRLAPLSPAELQTLKAAESDERRSPARRELVAEGDPIRQRRAVLSGWACRQRILPDGRRQILGFLLPGDLIGVCQHRNPIAATTILAVTELLTCPAPAAEPGGGLAEAYARSAAFDEHYLMAQITRVGRFNAYERLADWLLETRDRLAMIDLAGGDGFRLPLTQEFLADALGLTPVHVNRTLQAMRRDGLLASQGGMISFPDVARLERLVGYSPVRVSSAG